VQSWGGFGAVRDLSRRSRHQNATHTPAQLQHLVKVVVFHGVGREPVVAPDEDDRLV